MRSAYITVVCVLAIGCGSKKDLKSAKSSVYDTDFAVVYNAAVEATRELYPALTDNPGPGMVKTAWHKVPYASNEDDLANQRTVAMGQGYGGGTTPGQNMMGGVDNRLNFKQYFVRFDVSVVGGRPWRVKVNGQASVWEPGNALPTDLKGAARPHWVEGRQDALTLAIYKKIKRYAVPAKKQEEETPKPVDTVVRTDPKLFTNVPPTAAIVLAKLRDALVQRDYPALRTQLADDIVWSLGGSPGADTAMAMWQADSEALEAMQRVIAKGCASVEQKVTCPPQAAEPIPGTYSLVLEMRGDAWKVTSFVKAE